jgi:NhaP-type Na+/H+ or K+/H+ antiporter
MSSSIFFKNFSPIMFLAFLGTCFSAFVTAGIMYGLSAVSNYPLTFLESLTYGSIISATDPVKEHFMFLNFKVSVLATFNEVSVSPNLNMIIFGESALNDAVAIILYRFTVKFADPSATFTTATFFITTLTAIGVFLGSVALGVAIGLVLAKIMKHANIYTHFGYGVEMAFVLIFGYSSYLIAELASLSGIVAILFCGASMSHYLVPNLSEKCQFALKVGFIGIC